MLASLLPQGQPLEKACLGIDSHAFRRLDEGVPEGRGVAPILITQPPGLPGEAVRE
jgi:hypothetical protein